MDRAQVLKKLEGYGLTRFRKRVLMATFSIPRGETRTYKEVARMAGYPKAYRAVGSALRDNPMAPAVPCHRVVKSDGSLGNYSGRGGRAGKRMLLKTEGAV
jgi:O-6-methylguanine DNA methyltransferase